MNKELVNSSHYSEKSGYYEWWYFDFVSKSGNAFNIVLHQTDIFGIGKQSYYSVSFLSKNGEHHYLKSKSKGFQINKGGKYLLVENNLFIEDETSIKFNLPLENNIVLKGEINKGMPGKMVRDGVLYENKNNFGMWLPFVVQGDFNADLSTDGIKRHFEGFSYHDHQWGNLPIQRYVKDWVWGHLSGSGITFLFFKIFTNSDTVINRFYILNGLERKYGFSEIKTAFLNDLSQKMHPEKEKLRTVIGFEDYNLELEVNPDLLMRSRINEAIEDKTFTYLRWNVKGIYNKKLAMVGVTEYMTFR